MIGFFFKKNFYDSLDNFVALVLSNAIVFFIVALSSFFSLSFAIVIGLFPLCFHVFGLAGASAKWCTQNGGWFSAYKNSLKNQFWHTVLFYFVMLASIFSAYYAVNIFLAGTTLFSIACSFFVLAVTLSITLSIQYFPALSVRFKDDSPFKALKKCILIMLDNRSISLVLFLTSLVKVGVSVFIGFLFPGFASVAVSQHNAIMIIMEKYDWIEANPGTNEKNHREEYLFKIKQNYLTRSFKNLLFPWKDSR